MVRWVVRSNFHGGNKLFLVPASASMTAVTKNVVCATVSVGWDT